jgi:hypothetical protein
MITRSKPPPARGATPLILSNTQVRAWGPNAILWITGALA